MKKIITKENMKEISNNLMMKMSDEEIDIIQSEIQKSVDDLNKLSIFKTDTYNLENIQPMDFPNINVDNNFREDVVKQFKHKDKLLDNPKEKVKDLIKV